MKCRFTISRMLLAVTIFAVPFAMLGGRDPSGAVLALIVGVAAVGAVLLGRPQDLYNALLAAAIFVGFLVLFGRGDLRYIELFLSEGALRNINRHDRGALTRVIANLVSWGSILAVVYLVRYLLTAFRKDDEG